MLRSHSRRIAKSAAFSLYCITHRVIISRKFLPAQSVGWMSFSSFSRAVLRVVLVPKNNSRIFKQRLAQRYRPAQAGGVA